MRRSEIHVARVRRSDERSKGPRRRIDLAERLQASHRRVIVVGVQAGCMERIDLVGFGVGEIERARCRAGLDHVVEAGIARSHALNRREGNRLVGRSRILHVDDRAIGAAGQKQIAVRRQLQGIGIGLRHEFGLAGHRVETSHTIGQDRRRQQQAARPVAIDEFHQRRIANAVRIGIAQEHLVALEDDIVKAARGGRIGEAQGASHLVGRGIDQREHRVAVLILQRPDLAGVRVVFQAID